MQATADTRSESSECHMKVSLLNMMNVHHLFMKILNTESASVSSAVLEQI